MVIFNDFHHFFVTIKKWFYLKVVILVFFNGLKIANVRPLVCQKGPYIPTNVGNWWKCSGNELLAINLRQSNFFTQSNKCDRHGGTKVNKPIYIKKLFNMLSVLSFIYKIYVFFKKELKMSLILSQLNFMYRSSRSGKKVFR